MHQCNRYQLIAITSPSSSHQSRYQGDRSRRIAVTSRLPFADRGIFAIAISKSRPPQDRLSANRGSNALSELQHPRDCSHDSQYHHNCSLQIAASSRSLLRFAVSSRLLLRFTATIRSLLQIARYSWQSLLAIHGIRVIALANGRVLRELSRPDEDLISENRRHGFLRRKTKMEDIFDDSWVVTSVMDYYNSDLTVS